MESIGRKVSALLIASLVVSHGQCLPFCASTLPAPIFLNVPFVPQSNSNWCWAASSEMAVRYFNNGQGFTQCQMLEIGYNIQGGLCCSGSPLCNQQGDIATIQRLIGFFSGRNSLIASALNPNELYSVLQNGRPIVAHLNLATGGHFVVLKGMSFGLIPTPFGSSLVETVFLNDPAGILSSAISYADLVQVWDASVIVF